jgi:hypothetical protein
VRRKKAVDIARAPTVNSEALCSGLRDSELSFLESILDFARASPSGHHIQSQSCQNAELETEPSNNSEPNS